MKKLCSYILTIILLLTSVNVYAFEENNIAADSLLSEQEVLIDENEFNDDVETGNSINIKSINEDYYGGGYLRTPQEILDTIPVVPDVSFKEKSALPSSKDLSAFFPSVGNQGHQNSCVGWATAYYLKTSQEKFERGWDIKSDEHIFSPSYIYNQINDGIDKGAYITDAFDVLIEQGVCSISSMPFMEYNHTILPNSKQKTEASSYKISSYAYIPSNDVNKINKMKNELIKNNSVIIGVDIYPDFDKLNATSNRIYDDFTGVSRGGHALCIVGYDDSINAFKFVNSWGKSWGINGFGYISYDLIENSDVTNEVYVTYDSINNQRIMINKSELDLDIGSKFSLTADVQPETPGVQSYTWESSNTSVATVNSLGEVTAVSKGVANITVSERASGKSATCAVTVYGSISVGKVETEINPLANDTFKVYLRDTKYTDGKSLENAWFAVWTENNEQDDLIWYEGQRVSGTNDWFVTVKTTDHKNEVGKYITHIYIRRSVQDKYLNGLGYTIENKILYDEVVKENLPVYGRTYKIIIKNVRYSTGLTPNKVLFPTWTINNEQDDLIWHEGTKIEGTNDWQVNIKVKDHNNENGQYRTHIYAENNDGRKFVCQSDSNVSIIDITSSEVVTDRISNNYMKITVKNVLYSDNTVPNKVMFPTWTENNEQDDLIWYEGTRISGTNDWYILIDKSKHNYETGNYITHIYVRPFGNGENDRMIRATNYDMDNISGWTCMNTYNTGYIVGSTIDSMGYLFMSSYKSKTISVNFQSNFEVKSGDEIYFSMGSYFSGDEAIFDQAVSYCNATLIAENGQIISYIDYELRGNKTNNGKLDRVLITDETAGKLVLEVSLEGSGMFNVDVDLDYVCVEINGKEL